MRDRILYSPSIDGLIPQFRTVGYVKKYLIHFIVLYIHAFYWHNLNFYHEWLYQFAQTVYIEGKMIFYNKMHFSKVLFKNRILSWNQGSTERRTWSLGLDGLIFRSVDPSLKWNIQVIFLLVGLISAQSSDSEHVTTNQRFASEYCEVYGCNPLKAVTAVRYCRICIRGHNHMGTYHVIGTWLLKTWNYLENEDGLKLTNQCKGCMNRMKTLMNFNWN